MSKFDIQKGEKVKIVTAIIDWPPDSPKSERVLDIRTWVQTKEGKWIATQKGVQIPMAMAKKFGIGARKIIKAELGEE